MRHRVLLIGPSGAGKSQNAIELAVLRPENMVYVFDFQGGLAPLLFKRGDKPANLEILLPEGDDLRQVWDWFKDKVKEVRTTAGPGDWLVFDPADDIWQVVQYAYAMQRYGQDWADVIQEQLETEKRVQFGGFTSEDWKAIKPRSYLGIPATLSPNIRANVLVTAFTKTVVSWEDKKTGQMVYRDKDLPDAFKRAGVKPGGEGEVAERVDIIIQMDHPTEKVWRCRVLGKNRLGLEWDWTPVTDSSAVQLFLESVKEV